MTSCLGIVRAKNDSIAFTLVVGGRGIKHASKVANDGPIMHLNSILILQKIVK